MNLEYIISGLVGLATGAIGSLVAPWIHWKIEERKELQKSKIELIKSLRAYLENNEPREQTFLNSADYVRIRPYLSEAFVSDLENFNESWLKSTFRSIYKVKFLEEIDNIEED